jgi:replicative superfamily II helicase
MNMPPVKLLTDQNELVATKNLLSYLHFPFPTLNPVQSRIAEVYDKDSNVIIAASTSSGKTICGELILAHEIRERGRKGLYLAPLRALAKEKIDDWTSPDHHFSDLNLAICTGDYRLTPSRKKELEDADLILMTSEMLSSRCRNYKSEMNEWLMDVGVVVTDEVHLLTVPGRGDHLEVGLMKFSEINPNARIVGLSATMPNVSEIAEWVAYFLNGKETYLINSTYRPCPLGVHWEEYQQLYRYEATEEEKCNTALLIIEDYPDDRFLVFVHTKRTGQMMKNALTRAGITCEYHNADLNKVKRHQLENRFRSGNLRVLVATSGLSWGMNLPARRVIIVGVHRGINEVETYDIWQEIGRSGRPGFDPRGDAYILLPDKKFDYHYERLSKPQKIESRLLEYIGTEEKPHYKNLAFHLVSEIHHGIVKTVDDIHRWYERSLGHFQSGAVEDDIVDRTLELLIKCGAVWKEDDEYTVTTVGRVASMFYYSPFDVADLKRNFSFVFDRGWHQHDFAVSMALGNVDTQRMGFASKGDGDLCQSGQQNVWWCL